MHHANYDCFVFSGFIEETFDTQIINKTNSQAVIMMHHLSVYFRKYILIKTVFTACIRGMREGNSFSLSTLAWGLAEYPIPGPDRWGYPILLTWGGTPSQVWVGGPCRRSGLGGVPHPADQGGTPSQVWTGGVPHPRSRRGIPHPADGGYLSQVWTGG